MEHFKSIPELIQSLNQLALRINKGSVGLEEFETTLRDARELYERLVILRYKAIEDRNLMGGMPSGEERGSGNSDQEPNLAARQISLIDSIEEISRETTIPEAEQLREEPPEKRENAMTAQISLNMEPAEEPHIEPVDEQPESEQKVEPKEPEHSEVIPPITQDIGGSARPDSLAEKLSQTRIDDLTVAIGLNQKFQFIKELFEGDANAYAEAVKKLNRYENRQEAMDYLHNEVKEPYGWDEEDETTLAFLSLVERRYA